MGMEALFPCCFGSALKLTGIEALLRVLSLGAPSWESNAPFAARVFKISRDPQGNRLTWLKVTGGVLQVRKPLAYKNARDEALEEKPVQLRLYSGDKFAAAEQVEAGRICAVTGLSGTWIGQGLGDELPAPPAAMEPVMTYRVALPAGKDPATVMPLLRQLEEEDPQLHVLWNSHTGQIHVQIMGKVQLEVVQQVLQDRFSLDARLDQPRIFYKETIENTVEGVGHYEPLRHYAEVHLLLEPLPRGAGLVFDTVCATDVLDAQYQHLVMGHLSEKTHLGVLTGSPITDMKITLLIGRAHNKHTEGGDFRQATYRAVRQGLMQAKSVLLEPWYDFVLTVPLEQVGRAITDIRAMSGEPEAPESVGSTATVRGCVPASEIQEYAQTLAAYTQGMGQLQLALKGYLPCHNAAAVIEEMGYDAAADKENSPHSVFCAHGAGFHVPWDQVTEYMHLESPLKAPKPEVIVKNLQAEDKALEAILRREFGDLRTPLYKPAENRPAEEKLTIRPPRQQYLIVDGYNIIFAWDDLAAMAKHDLDAARRHLMDRLSSFAGFRKCRLVLVFDGYKAKGNPGEKSQFHNIQVVYTSEGETADAYIEGLVSQIGSNYAVKVATSDSLVQLSSLRSGVLRMSARELQMELDTARKEMGQYMQ